MTVVEAALDFEALIDRVVAKNIVVELVRDDRVVVRLEPVKTKPAILMKDFGAFLASLPSLGDDAESFARDVEEGRESTRPKNPSP